jgi:hypothetical protein
MEIHYYLSIFPTEALIASQMSPVDFGSYMATGAKSGSYERMIFIEIEGGFGRDFDWKYAEERTVPHPDGTPKRSVWLAVYRVLENTPLDKMKSLYLVTQDGRVLELGQTEYTPPEVKRDFYVYQELCPVTPLVVTVHDPRTFGVYMTHKEVHTRVPKIAFADLKVVNFDNLEDTGNIGGIYDRNIDHLKDCILAVTKDSVKKVKNVERSPVESFGYQTINQGIYIGDGESLLMYPMPSIDEMRRDHFDFGRSAMIL